jgi:hypothetical protein
MPNGDYSLSREDWAKIKAFFADHSALLLAFATAHNLAIDEYYHDAPAWTFRFRHPKGGGAGIHVQRLDDSTIRIGKLWYIDDYDTFTHHTKSETSSELPLSQIDLREVLEESLREIATWNKTEMIASRGYEKFWSRYSREEWTQMSPDETLPQPKL